MVIVISDLWKGWYGWTCVSHGQTTALITLQCGAACGDPAVRHTMATFVLKRIIRLFISTSGNTICSQFKCCGLVFCKTCAFLKFLWLFFWKNKNWEPACGQLIPAFTPSFLGSRWEINSCKKLWICLWRTSYRLTAVLLRRQQIAGCVH